MKFTKTAQLFDFKNLVLLVLMFFPVVHSVCSETPTKQPFLFKKIHVNTSSISEKSRYFYIAPFYGHHKYDSGRCMSYFIHLLNEGNHHLWWDTGLILKGSTIGYRYTLEPSYLAQSWFLGSYLAYDWYGTCFLEGKQKQVYRLNGGAELVGSRLGQLTVNVYGLPNQKPNDLNNLCTEGVDWTQLKWIRSNPFKTIDDRGVSIKWVTRPHASSLQASIVLARSWVKHKTDQGWFKEHVDRFGAGLQYVLSDWVHLDMQYMFCDTYQSGWHIGFKIGNTHISQSPDRLRGWLNRPAERHIPCYKLYQGLQLSSNNDSPLMSIPFLGNRQSFGGIDSKEGPPSTIRTPYGVSTGQRTLFNREELGASQASNHQRGSKASKAQFEHADAKAEHGNDGKDDSPSSQLRHKESGSSYRTSLDKLFHRHIRETDKAYINPSKEKGSKPLNHDELKAKRSRSASGYAKPWNNEALDEKDHFFDSGHSRSTRSKSVETDRAQAKQSSHSTRRRDPQAPHSEKLVNKEKERAHPIDSSSQRRQGFVGDDARSRAKQKSYERDAEAAYFDPLGRYHEHSYDLHGKSSFEQPKKAAETFPWVDTRSGSNRSFGEERRRQENQCYSSHKMPRGFSSVDGNRVNDFNYTAIPPILYTKYCDFSELLPDGSKRVSRYEDYYYQDGTFYTTKFIRSFILPVPTQAGSSGHVHNDHWSSSYNPGFVNSGEYCNPSFSNTGYSEPRGYSARDQSTNGQGYFFRTRSNSKSYSELRGHAARYQSANSQECFNPSFSNMGYSEPEEHSPHYPSTNSRESFNPSSSNMGYSKPREHSPHYQSANSREDFKPKSNSTGYSEPKGQSSHYQSTSQGDKSSTEQKTQTSTATEFAELTRQAIATIKSCSAKELGKFYRQASLQYHPDKRSGESEAEIKAAKESFNRLSECYQDLLKQKATVAFGSQADPLSS